MIRKLFLIFLGCICGFAYSSAKAEDIFWTFNDHDEPVVIPPECDGRFDDVRGGVFMPTTEEVYTNGMNFLRSNIESVQKQAPYCILVAALDGHSEAQLELARMYNEGKLLPQDDLSAYKWSFIAALNGNKKAEKFALTLEQFLTTSELDATSSAIQEARIQIQEAQQKKLENDRDAMQADLAKVMDQQREGLVGNANGDARGIVAPNALLPIFNEEDRFR